MKPPSQGLTLVRRSEYRNTIRPPKEIEADRDSPTSMTYTGWKATHGKSLTTKLRWVDARCADAGEADRGVPFASPALRLRTYTFSSLVFLCSCLSEDSR